MKKQKVIGDKIKRVDSSVVILSGLELHYSFYEISLSNGKNFFAIGIEAGDESVLSVTGDCEAESRHFFERIVSCAVTPCTLADILRDNMVAGIEN